VIPVPAPQGASPAFKVIPDSELVYGPYSASFDIPAFIESQQGYLAQYQEEVDGVTLSGPQVVARVALENSVNPRLLLAVLQYRSKWLTRDVPREETLEFPLGLPDANRSGLYRQLFWAANELNRGYYLWRVNAIGYWLLADGAVIPAEPTVNAGTAGVQHLFALFYGVEDWQQAVGEQGLFAVYQDLFGYPFDYPYEPLLPADLTQPPMQLPFEPGKAWAFTGGPHGGWGDGAAWAAIDFAPPGEALGCVESDEWVVAVSDGLIVRAENGAVIQDVDGDGLEQTGWTILYMHIESRERVRPSAYLRAGERIGHPSCEGGFSTGTHLHLARRYNGEWIPADGPTPFVMDSWITAGAGIPYDGFLRRDGRSIEAWNGRSPENEIQR
jgi:murein DD-endopeptidase MepM/ murein hydrolase activator NlpD